MSEMRKNETKTGMKPMGGGPMGGGHIRGIPEKPKDFKGTMKKLIGYLKPYLFSIIVVILFAVGSSVFSIIGPKILGKVTTKIFEGLIGKVSGAQGAALILNISETRCFFCLGYILSVQYSPLCRALSYREWHKRYLII